MAETFTVSVDFAGFTDEGIIRHFWSEMLEGFDGTGTVWIEGQKVSLQADFTDPAEAARFTALLQDVAGLT